MKVVAAAFAVALALAAGPSVVTGQVLSNTYELVYLSPPWPNSLPVGTGGGTIASLGLTFGVRNIGATDVNINFPCDQWDCGTSLTIEFINPNNTVRETSTSRINTLLFGRVNYNAVISNVDNPSGLTIAGSLRVTLTHQDLILQLTVAMTPGAVDQIGTSVSSAISLAGSGITLTAQAMDQYSNVVTDSSPLSLIVQRVSSVNTTYNNAGITVLNGVGTYLVTTNIVEDIELTVTHTSLPVTPGVHDVIFNPGPTQRVLFRDASLETTAGGTVTAVIEALDQYGNVNSNELSRINILQNSADPTMVQFSNGVSSLAISSSTPQYMTVGLSQATFNDQQQLRGVIIATTMQINFTAVCDGVTEYQDLPHQITCNTVRGVCEPGTFESSSPNATSNRICTACDGTTQYQDQSDQQSCLNFSVICSPGEYQSTFATSSTDRECSSCTLYQDFSSEENAFSCTNVTECIAGETFISETTLTSDRVCEPCAFGFYDSDGPDLYGACSPCNEELTADVTFDGYGSVTVQQEYNQSVSFSFYALPLGSGSGSGNGQSVAMLTILGSSCLDLVEVADIATHDLATHEWTDGSLSLLGETSIFGRGFNISFSDGSWMCEDLTTWVGSMPTYTDEVGQSICKNMTQCTAGEEASIFITDESDQECVACNGETEFQDLDNRRFCSTIQICPIGEREFAAPNASSDRVCGTVTCPGLDPPLYGDISVCTGSNVTENYLTECVYSCPADLFFRQVPENLATRICQQNGEFSGEPYVCECFGSLKLDPNAGRCTANCPEGSITGPDESTCVDCAPGCQEGEFESTSCDPSAETDRVCSPCSECPYGTWAVGGCFANSSIDTICQEWTPCDPGFYEILPAPTSTTDRTCGQCDPCVDGLYAFSGCCGTENTECDALSTCASDEFEPEPPATAPQGGAGSDRRCQKVKECGSGEWKAGDATATSDTDCRECRICPENTFKTADCTARTDTVCSPHSSCNPGVTFPFGGSPFADVSCKSCSVCSESEYEASPCGDEDTECVPISICDPVTEYEIQTPTLTSNRVCGNCTVCGGDEVISEPCGKRSLDGSYMDTVCLPDNGTNIQQCPRGQAPMGTCPYCVCVDCFDCNGVTEFAKEGKYCLDDPIQIVFAPRCEPVTTCAPGFVESAPPTVSTDRVCSKGASCPSGSYSNSSLLTANVADLNCINDPPCEAGTYETAPNTPTSPRICVRCSGCPVGEYVSRSCGNGDTVCSKISECATNEVVLRPATLTSDTFCVSCGLRVSGNDRPNNDPFRCTPDAPDTCPFVPGTSMPGPANTYSAISFMMPYDFVSIVMFDPTYIHQLDYFTEQLADYLAQFLDGVADPQNVTVSPGSIVVDFYVTDTVNGSSHNESAADAVDLLSSGFFEMEYFGDLLTIDTASIVVSEVDPILSTSTIQPMTTLTTSMATVPPITAEASDDDGLSEGAVAGITVAVITVLLLIVAVLAIKKQRSKRDPWRSGGVYNDTKDDLGDNDQEEYLNMNPDDETGVFDSQISGENRKLQDEVNQMKRRIAEKNAVISGQLKSQRQAQETLEVAIAAKLAKENDVLQEEIKAMKKDLKKKQADSKFQSAAATQAKLKAEKLALQEEIARSDEVAQIALDALAEYDTLHRTFEEEEVVAREAELKRIETEKERLASEMRKLEEQQENVYSPGGL